VKVLPYNQSIGKGCVVINADGIKAKLIKNGDISGSTFTSGMLVRASVANQFYFANVMLNATNTVNEACLVKTPSVDVPMGNHNKKRIQRCRFRHRIVQF